MDLTNPKLKPQGSRGDAEDLIELELLQKGPHRIVCQYTSPFQEVMLVENKNLRLYINQQLQFNSLDERIYHEALVHPAMALVPKREKVLIVGGNDGLILREVLKYQDVTQVCLVDNDLEMIRLAKTLPQLTGLNNKAFSDQRVQICAEDLEDYLRHKAEHFDVIVVDFLDPADQEISLKYRRKTFRLLSRFLSRDGILVCQGCSPEGMSLIFWSIAKTLESTGLKTLSYHVNVPSFGDWGFHLASKSRLTWQAAPVLAPTETMPEDLDSWFSFSQAVIEQRERAEPNTKQNLVLHRYFADSAQNNQSNLLDNYNQLGNTGKIQGDLEDRIELRQCLSMPNNILYQGSSQEHDLLLVEISELRMYLDKQLQFSSLDEGIYHEALVHPALTLAPGHSRVLILGGGDGLAMREVLKYQDVQRVDLVDLDPAVLHVARTEPHVVNLNSSSLYDNRIRVYQQDAQVFVPSHKNLYCVVIVDFPDPSEEIVSRLYTEEFFSAMFQCLVPGGILVCQSHSPQDAPTVFWSIGATLESIGLSTLSYHVYVPSFGDWGFHLAAKSPLTWQNEKIPVPLRAFTGDITSLFKFPEKVLTARKLAQVNSLGNLTLHKLYQVEVG